MDPAATDGWTEWERGWIEGNVYESMCVCVFVYECVLDGFIVGKAEQMGPPYQRVQQNRIQPTVI